MRLLDGHMNQIINKLEAHESKTPSRWREAAEYRQANKSWLRHSQRIAMLMLDKMDELHLTQTELARRMGCSQQYVSKILRGKENLSIETLCSHPLKTIFQHKACTNKLYADSFYKVQKNSHSSFEVICCRS